MIETVRVDHFHLPHNIIFLPEVVSFISTTSRLLDLQLRLLRFLFLFRLNLGAQTVSNYR